MSKKFVDQSSISTAKVECFTKRANDLGSLFKNFGMVGMCHYSKPFNVNFSSSFIFEIGYIKSKHKLF